MADLVQRLRDWERIYREDQDEPDHCLYLKAADRIEKLQAEIEELHYAVTAAHLKGYMDGKQAAEAKLVFASKMLPRATIAILKDRKQEAIDVIETVIEELKGGSYG